MIWVTNCSPSRLTLRCSSGDIHFSTPFQNKAIPARFFLGGSARHQRERDCATVFSCDGSLSPPLLISDISPFVCTVITVSGSFSLRENDEEEEEEEEEEVEEEVGELSPHHLLLLCGETSSSSPACCKARYGCGGIP